MVGTLEHVVIPFSVNMWQGFWTDFQFNLKTKHFLAIPTLELFLSGDGILCEAGAPQPNNGEGAVGGWRTGGDGYISYASCMYRS